MREKGIKEIYNEIGKEPEEETENDFEEYLSLEKEFNLDNGAEIRTKVKNLFLETVVESKKETENMEDWSEKVEEKTSKIGFIFLDVNGLKAINDLASHNAGDEYLKRTVQAFLRNEEINEFIEEYNLEIRPARAGGDEFAVLVERKTGRLDESIDEEDTNIITSLREKILEEVGKIKMDDLIDFKNQEILEKMGEQGRNLLSEWPGEYFFQASIAGGECLFSEGFKDYLRKYGEEERRLPLNKIIDGLVGSIMDLSGDRMKNNKAEFKKNQSHLEKYISARTEEERVLVFQIMRMEKIIEELILNPDEEKRKELIKRYKDLKEKDES